MSIKDDLARDDEELARKLAAAYIAHHLRYRSIDRVRKRYVDPTKKIGTQWLELARHARIIARSLGYPSRTEKTQ